MTANQTSPAVADLIASNGLSDMVAARTQSAMASLVSQKEEAIKAALNHLMAGWAPSDVIRRCELRTQPGDESEYFCIDGYPVLQFYPVEFSQRQTKASYFITATQRVRKLK